MKNLDTIKIGMKCNMLYAGFLKDMGCLNIYEVAKEHVLDPAYKEMLEIGLIEDNIEGRLFLIEQFKIVATEYINKLYD